MSLSQATNHVLLVAFATVVAGSDKPDGVQQSQYGMVVRAEGGGFRNVRGTMIVPADWPDQQRVQVVKQELPPGATVSFKEIEDAGRQMTIHIPSLAAGQEARAVVTFEVELLRPPTVSWDTATLVIPGPSRLSRKMAVYLTPSPHIESDHPLLCQTADEVIRGREGAWSQVQAIQGWVFANIRYEFNRGKPQGVPETLRTRVGDCDEKNSLAVAMCRAMRIPARLVRIPGHCCYEFYLQDADGRGHWIFGDASARAEVVAGLRVPGVILQKGDSFTIVDPKTRRYVKERFLADGLTGLPLARGAQLQLKLISPAMAQALVPRDTTTDGKN